MFFDFVKCDSFNLLNFEYHRSHFWQGCQTPYANPEVSGGGKMWAVVYLFKAKKEPF